MSYMSLTYDDFVPFIFLKYLMHLKFSISLVKSTVIKNSATGLKLLLYSFVIETSVYVDI